MQLQEFPTNDDFLIEDWEVVFSEIDLVPEDINSVEVFWAESPTGWGSKDMTVLGILNIGDYVVIDAWADTSGWDCQNRVRYTVHGDRLDAIRFGMSERARYALWGVVDK